MFMFIEVQTVHLFQKHLSRAVRVLCERQIRDWKLLLAPSPGHIQMANICDACT